MWFAVGKLCDPTVCGHSKFGHIVPCLLWENPKLVRYRRCWAYFSIETLMVIVVSQLQPRTPPRHASLPSPFPVFAARRGIVRMTG
jgi:hypothetical protein